MAILIMSYLGTRAAGDRILVAGLEIAVEIVPQTVLGVITLIILIIYIGWGATRINMGLPMGTMCGDIAA